MARLVCIAQRLYLADAKDRGNGTVNSLESLIEHAKERMHCSGIEQGEIDIQQKDSGLMTQQQQQPLETTMSSDNMDDRGVHWRAVPGFAQCVVIFTS